MVVYYKIRMVYLLWFKIEIGSNMSVSIAFTLGQTGVQFLVMAVSG